MIFSKKTRGILEYDRVLEFLSACCTTAGARRRAKELMPSDDPVVVRRRLAYTTDARRLLDRKGFPIIDAYEDVPESAERAEKGATLSTVELLHIAALLRSVKSCEDYIRTNHEFDTVLDEVFARLMPNVHLEREITRCILTPDTISDEASPALSHIRRSIRLTHNRIKDSLQSYVSGNRQRALQENLVTMRDGRYVVPVKQEYKNEVKGIIHDTSSSGATVFIEPMAVVEANNELRTLEIKEAREIERILAELSSACGDASSAIRLNYQNMVDLSFYFACAALSQKMDANEALLEDYRVIDLKRARHPLIDKEKVVPVSVSLGKEYDTLIITGPNTGGKTVTLKTMGLFAAMTQSGLHIPADYGSTMGIFDAILADIGDEQSIEESLSTFSSHMVTIVEILENVTSASLVLFDELGSGTDPVEGAALATAILEETRGAGALTAATTHYTELKMYALDTPRVCNASCEFDVETLRPTYRLIVGTPGKSNAFAISEKLGIPPHIVERAKSLVSGEDRRFETVLEELESTRLHLDREREEAERLRKDYEIFKRESEIRLRERTRETEEALKRDREKARQLLDNARITSEFVFRQLEEIRKQQDKERLAQELEEARRKVREQLRESEAAYDAITYLAPDEGEEYIPSHPLKQGDKVYILSYHSEGELLSAPRGDTVEVRAGVFRGRVPVKEVRLLADMKQGKKKDKPKSVTKVERGGISAFKSELDVRGRYGDDGWFEVDRYLDEAVLSGLETVRIIHGKGTGALRTAIWNGLKKDPRVKSYRMGNLGEGDSGVTIVTLK